ncbi:TRAP transporter small permease [Bacillus gobiensis]|uniref:TRAP transporter small permease n=1 Tax=Bacillus gobiensis TaxID=1441095 RepID=UPI003D1D5C74
MMKSLKTQMDRMIMSFCILLLIFMVFVGLWQVFTRYVLASPSPFSEELLRFSLIWISLLGGSYAFGQKKHIAILFIVRKFPHAIKKAVKMVVECFIILFSVVIMIGGGIRAVLLTVEQTSAALGISMSVVYFVLPLAGLVITGYSLIHLIEIYHETDEEKEHEILID